MARVVRSRGTVREFDEHRGLGVIVGDDTGTEHPFHCIELADGTRAVDVGARVEFTVGFDALGRPEATTITKH